MPSFADDPIFVRTQAADGTVHDNWGATPIHITDLAITPDLTRLVTVGMYYRPDMLPPNDTLDDPTRNSNGDTTSPNSGGNGIPAAVTGSNSRMVVYDLTTQTETCVEI